MGEISSEQFITSVLPEAAKASRVPCHNPPPPLLDAMIFRNYLECVLVECSNAELPAVCIAEDRSVEALWPVLFPCTLVNPHRAL